MGQAMDSMHCPERKKVSSRSLTEFSQSGHSKLPSPSSEAMWVLTCTFASIELAVILRPWGLLVATWGFPSSSAGEESACNGGDPGSIPGSGRSAGEGIGYPLKSSWASLVAQLVKNLPAMQETWIRSLGWGDTLEKGKVPTPVFWPGEFHGLYSPWGHKDQTQMSDFHFLPLTSREGGGAGD